MKSELRKFIVDNYLFGRDSGFEDSESFMERGIIDSTGVMELIAYIEQRWQVAVEDHELLPENLDSLEQLERFVGRKLAASGQSYVPLAEAENALAA
jgi:acyl carrier protein